MLELGPTDPTGPTGVDPVRMDTKDQKDAEVTDFQATSPTTMKKVKKCPCLPNDLALAMAKVPMVPGDAARFLKNFGIAWSGR